jgi:hypothetical protein
MLKIVEIKENVITFRIFLLIIIFIIHHSSLLEIAEIHL